jgi:hypothetical protein
MMGEPAAHIVRIGPGPENKRLFEELHILAQHWVMLAGNGALGNLEEHEDVKAVKARGGSMPDQLRAYLEAYRPENGFDQWRYEHMSDVRSEVVEVCYEFQQKKGDFTLSTEFLSFHSRVGNWTNTYPDSSVSTALRKRRQRDEAEAEASKIQERLVDEKSKLVEIMRDNSASKDMV